MKRIIIIGGGISGLSAGIYALKYGYSPLILEKNPVAGGLCTNWVRKGMNIEGCIHWLTGTNKNTRIYQHCWTDLHAFKDEELIYLPTWGSYHYEGTTVHFYRDLDKTEAEWNKIAPEDKKMIHRFIKLVRKIERVDLPLDAPALLLPFKVKMKFFMQLVKTFPYYLGSMVMNKYRFAKKFKNPALRWALMHAQPGAGNLYSMAFSYSTITTNNGAVPRGGSKTFINNMLNYYLSQGGEIKYNAEVKELIVNKKEKKMTGAKLKSGEVVKGDHFISCCDANYVLINLLKQEYVKKKLAERFNEPLKHPSPSCVLINYRIPANVDINIPYNFKVDNFKLGTKEIDHINFRVFNYDPTFVNGEYTVGQVLLDQDSNDYDYWLELRKDDEKYQAFKQEIADLVKKLIEKELPILKGKMELLDVATPMTFTRYTNASRGSYMAFLFNPDKGTIVTRGYLKGINNFMLSGQYVQSPGGIPLAMASGKFSIQWLAKKDGKKL